MSLTNEFGRWGGNLDERLKELNSRLLAWYLILREGGSDLSEVFETAKRRFQEVATLELQDRILPADDVPAAVAATARGILLQAFEDALDDFDQLNEVTQDVEDNQSGD